MQKPGVAEALAEKSDQQIKDKVSYDSKCVKKKQKEEKEKEKEEMENEENECAKKQPRGVEGAEVAEGEE